MKHRPMFQQLMKNLAEPRKHIQVLLGPRQVGKTTLALQVAEEIKKPTHYISADLATLQDLSWLHQEWEIARKMTHKKKGGLLIIDEVQKIPKWSDVIKALWDQDTKEKTNLSVVILGSSPWLMQRGLSESLAGRFEVIPVTHWSFGEMQKHFGWDLEKYLYFGGYPGSASYANEKDPTRWMQYINDSLIETTLSRDILLMTQINKPALLRRLFQLGGVYSGQILSYNKMLGELQDAGNTTTLAHYLDLLSGAGLLCGLQKFASQIARQKSSSPKFMVYNTALMSALVGKTFATAKKDPAYWGRVVESAVGAHLLNNLRGTNIELYYWREEDHEIDFVLRHLDVIVGIEVKSKKETLKRSGADLFFKRFPKASLLLVGEKGMSLERFLKTPLKQLAS